MRAYCASQHVLTKSGTFLHEINRYILYMDLQLPTVHKADGAASTDVTSIPAIWHFHIKVHFRPPDVKLSARFVRKGCQELGDLLHENLGELLLHV
jgi:hypothetical protein